MDEANLSSTIATLESCIQRERNPHTLVMLFMLKERLDDMYHARRAPPVKLNPSETTCAKYRDESNTTNLVYRSMGCGRCKYCKHPWYVWKDPQALEARARAAARQALDRHYGGRIPPAVHEQLTSVRCQFQHINTSFFM